MLPSDPAIPALQALEARGIQTVLAEAGIRGCFRLERVVRHRSGRRCSLLLDGPQGKAVVKTYRSKRSLDHFLAATDALKTSEAVCDRPIKVPALLGHHPVLNFAVSEWLDTPSIRHLIEAGDGFKAGKLAAIWLGSAPIDPQCFAPVKHQAPPLERAADKTRTIGTAIPRLRPKAERILQGLRFQAPPRGPGAFCHGSFKPEHLFDVGAGLGIVDWDSAELAAPELDAGTFLAALASLKIRHPNLSRGLDQCRSALLATTGGWLDCPAISWYETFALLKAAGTACRRGNTAEPLAERLLDQAVGLLAG